LGGDAPSVRLAESLVAMPLRLGWFPFRVAISTLDKSLENRCR
jgi:hypothetical protein